MGMSGQPSNQAPNMMQAHTGQQLHVSGVFIVLLELALVVENMLPILVVVVWLPAPARGVSDRLVAAFSVTCILSAFVPTPLGLASYFSGGWYGGAATCTTYQVTSIWCNLSSLALLTYICINCHFAVWHQMNIRSKAKYQPCRSLVCASVSVQDPTGSSYTSSHLPSTAQTPSQPSISGQRHVSENSALPSDASAFVKSSSPRKAANCQNNTNENIVIVPKGTMNLNTETAGSKSDCRNIIYMPSQQPIELSEERTVVAKTEDNIQSNSQYCNGLMAVHYVAQNTTQRENEYSLSFEDNFLQCDEPNPTQSRTRAVNNFHNNADADTSYQSTRNQPNFQPNEQSAASKYFASASSGIIEACIETGSDLKYSEITPAVMSDRLEGDQKHSEYNCSKGSTEEPNSVKVNGCLCMPVYKSRDYVPMMLFLLFTCTLAISSLPVVGLGPRTTHTETSCRSWLVPIPVCTRERTFFVVYLFFVYTCLILGCGSGISVCLRVSKRMKQERKRKSRLYHEEENVPDIVELSTLDDMKRHYSLTCVVMCGLLTWLPIVTMLTLQKAGVQVSEATLMYSNIATSLPGLLNPLLYSLALARYRIGYKVIMEKCCCKNRIQKSHRLKDAHVSTNTADAHISTDTALNTSPDGHTCLHGRINPSFHNHLEVSLDETDDENDEDYFPDDGELIPDDKKEETQKPSEKTPLQAMPASATSTGALKTVLMNRAKLSWQRQQDAFSSSCSDSESLLVPKSFSADEETGL